MSNLFKLLLVGVVAYLLVDFLDSFNRGPSEAGGNEAAPDRATSEHTANLAGTHEGKVIPISDDMGVLRKTKVGRGVISSH